jgi:hypothetical protein
MYHTQTFDDRKPDKNVKKEETKTRIKEHKSVSLMHSPKTIKVSSKHLRKFLFLKEFRKSELRSFLSSKILPDDTRIGKTSIKKH